jgi:hypothetical protein
MRLNWFAVFPLRLRAFARSSTGFVGTPKAFGGGLWLGEYSRLNLNQKFK